MTRTTLVALLCTALAAPAAALSCQRPTVTDSFALANEADAVYAVAVGEVTLLPGEAIPEQVGDPNQKEGYAVEARLDGWLATEGGFEEPASFPLRVQVECSGSWCGAPPEGEVLIFVERREDANVLVEGACPRFSFPASDEVMGAATACLSGTCPES